MKFILSGFSQDSGFRVFTFEGLETRQETTTYIVKADLELVRKYEILVQELPLLCRSLLERDADGKEACTLTLTEEEMRLHAENSANARRSAAQKKKHPPRQPVPGSLASPWGGSYYPHQTTPPIGPK